MLLHRHHTFKTLNYAQAAEVAISEYTHKEWIVKVTGYVIFVVLIINTMCLPPQDHCEHLPDNNPVWILLCLLRVYWKASKPGDYDIAIIAMNHQVF